MKEGKLLVQVVVEKGFTVIQLWKDAKFLCVS